MKQFQRFFRLTRKGRDGFFVLTIALSVVAVAPGFYLAFRGESPMDYSLIAFSDHHIPTNSDTKKQRTVVHDLHPFDPNTLSDAGWKTVGLSDKQIAVIRRYQQKGGKFRTKEDVRKMYVISDELYERIASQIQIIHLKPEQLSGVPNAFPKNASDDMKITDRVYADRSTDRVNISSIRIDINHADTSEWKKLRGIGSVFAARIVRFREALGGFSRVEQLKEVYGISTDLYAQLSPQLDLDSTAVRKLALNRLTAIELQKHPYINKIQAKHIVSYRNQHGDFRNMGDMRKIVVLDQDFFLKIEPYLDFQ